MATDQDFVEYVQSQSGLGERLSFKKMFGEYALYMDGKIVALACDNSLYLKPTEAGRKLLAVVVEARPFPVAKPYFLIDEVLDDPDRLRNLLKSTAEELPVPKPKKTKKRSKL